MYCSKVKSPTWLFYKLCKWRNTFSTCLILYMWNELQQSWQHYGRKSANIQLYLRHFEGGDFLNELLSIVHSLELYFCWDRKTINSRKHNLNVMAKIDSENDTYSKILKIQAELIEPWHIRKKTALASLYIWVIVIVFSKCCQWHHLGTWVYLLISKDRMLNMVCCSILCVSRYYWLHGIST